MSDPFDTSAPGSSADESAQKPSRLLWWLHPKVALPLILFGLILFSPLFYRAHRINSVPAIGEPFDVQAFGAVDIAPADNAMTQYTAAVGLYLEYSGIPAAEIVNAFDYGWEQTSEPLRKHLAANEPALAEWRKGTEQTQAVVVQPKDMNIDMRIDVVFKLRSMSGLALLKADQCLAEGDVESAWEWHRAAIRCGQHVSQNGCSSQRLVGISFFGQAAKGIPRWAEHPQVTAAQLQSAIEDLRTSEELATPNSEALKCEYVLLSDLLRRDRLDEFLDHSGGTLPSLYRGGTPPSLYRAQTLVLGEPEYSKRLIRHAFDNWLSEIDKPRWQQAPLSPGVFALFEIPASRRLSMPPRDLEARIMSQSLAMQLIPAVSQFNEAIQRAAACEAALKLTLACQLYHRLHGDWPARLEDLTPDVLSELPADPLGKSGETLRIKRDGDELIIYSVGWNGADDGGQLDVISSEGGWLDEGFRLRRPTKSALLKNSEATPQEKD